MTLPVDLALLETAAAAAAGTFLGIRWTGGRTAGASDDATARAQRTFLLVWIPPALARLATMLPGVDPRTSPELALPLAAPASAALAVLLVLAPLAYRASRNAPVPRRKVIGAVGLAAAILVAGIGFVAAPFDTSRLADAVADHASRCAALTRTPGSRAPGETRQLDTMVRRERTESAAEATRIHDRRGLPPALARLEERRGLFAERVGSLVAGLHPRALARPRPENRRSPVPTAPGPAPTAVAGRAGCAAVETGMAAREVERLLGLPDHKVSAEDVRGPRAERWAYARLLCRVHLVDGVVEFTD